MAKKYIVGIDYGHGETAAWIVPLNENLGMDADGESARLKASNIVNDRVMHSVIYKSLRGEYSLQRFPSASLLGKMKSRVSDLEQNPERREAYRNYIRLVVEALIQHNDILTLKDTDGKPNFYMCMASPTQWNDQDKNDYLRFFNEAVADLGISFEWIINESDAAFFSHKNIVSHDEVTLVIDFGSSTIDYTVMYQGKKVSDDKWSNPQLGAGNIESTILESYRAKDYDGYQYSYNQTEELLRTSGNSHIDIDSVLDYRCRIVKEEAYTNAQENTALEYHFGEVTGLKAQCREFRFVYDFSMSEITKAYRAAVKHDFEGLKEKIEEATGKQVGRVVLSGGACIMNWVRIMVMSIFPDAKIKADSTPSFVVARGIALYALAQKKALDELLDELKNVDYASMYRQADAQATKEAIRELSGSAVTEVRQQPNCIKMVDVFGEFIQHLDKNNDSYVSKVRAKVCNDVTLKVRNILKDVFCKYFKWNFDASTIDIGVDVECASWNVTMFNYEVRGSDVDLEKTGVWSQTIMVAISKIIERHQRFFTGANWTKSRSSDECNYIANELVGEVLKAADEWISTISYGDDNAFLELQSEDMKDQVLKIAADLFYENQLFRTTFT